MMAFGLLAQKIFSLDAAIEWVALEEAGREPRWAWRDPETGRLCAGMTTDNAELVDPLLLMLAEGRDDLYGDETSANPHHLLFVVLAYADLVRIVAWFGPEAHISVAFAPGTDAYALGTRLIKLLDRGLQQRLSVNAHGNVPT
jgi:hypothetical protein